MPRRNLVKSLIPGGLWVSKILFAQGRTKFRRLFLKVLRLSEFPLWYSRRKKWAFQMIML